jgi:hypothetical protein
VDLVGKKKGRRIRDDALTSAFHCNNDNPQFFKFEIIHLGEGRIILLSLSRLAVNVPFGDDSTFFSKLFD